MRLTISDGAYERETLAYLVGTLSDLFSQTGCNWFERADDDRAELTVEVPAFYADIVKGGIDDKISDIVSVSYKYDFFAKKIKPSGLSELENEILIASLIAADLEEDKRYVSRRIRADSEIAIDGLYHFRLKPLNGRRSARTCPITSSIRSCGSLSPFFWKTRASAFWWRGTTYTIPTTAI